MKESYSQLNQDINVITFFNKKSGLYFVDIGANDGITLSNTYLLEKKYDWQGICCEPLPNAFSKLKMLRDVICNNNAIFSTSDLDLEFSQSNLLSGITDYIDHHQNAKNGLKIIVRTKTLQDLLDKYYAPSTIHYLSLDTEGTEYEILKSVDFNKYTFLYINLEHNYVEPRRTNIRKLLTQNGYIYKGENRWDDDYIHESVIIGTYYHREDYTKPITIEKKEENKFIVSSPYWNDDYGEVNFNKMIIKWNRLGNGKIYYDHIDYGNGNVWQRRIFKKCP